MTTFNDFWKEKAQKRRKSWAAKAKRFAEQHTQLEDIRKEVYLPLDFGANFSFEDYKPDHFIKLNPITSWQDKNFCFSEEGLRAALEAVGSIDCHPAHHWHHAMVPSPRHSVSWSLPSPYSCSHRTEC